MALLKRDTTTESVRRALQWVIDNAAVHKIVAVNLSFGNINQVFDDPDDPDITTNSLADEFAQLRQNRVALVAGAGNGFQQAATQALGVAHPAIDRNVIAVGASFDSILPGSFSLCGNASSTAQDLIIPCSARHPELVDLFAPGAYIDVPLPNSTLLTQVAGTSFAASYVTGMAAIAQQIALEATGQRLDHDQLVAALRATGVNPSNGFGYVLDHQGLHNDQVPHPGAPTDPVYGSSDEIIKYPRLDGYALIQKVFKDSWTPCDADLDIDVDSNDLLILQGGWTGTGGTGQHWYDGDCDWDGDVDSQDLIILLENWSGAGGEGLAAMTDSSELDADLIKAKDDLYEAILKTDADIDGNGQFDRKDIKLIMSDFLAINAGVPANRVAQMVDGIASSWDEFDSMASATETSPTWLDPDLDSSLRVLEPEVDESQLNGG